jgi:8-amino-7-oxononanoate synthase
VPDFTSALYLGFRHPSASLAPWEQLTTGVPAALRAPAATDRVAAALAALIGCRRATLATSTLHLFCDLFVVLADRDASIHVDGDAYPIARWGVERAAARGVAASSFAHSDPEALLRDVRTAAARRRRPIVLTDGFCPGRGPAPLRAYRDVVVRYGGLLVVDDTQALGVLGERPGPDAPYGRGGGGSLRRQDVSAPNVIVGASLAKGFGAPVAVLAGDAATVALFEERAETRVHCSPPSAAAVRAAARAVTLNGPVGEPRRARLAEVVRRFRAGAAAAGFEPRGGLFPVQTLAGVGDAAALHVRLRRLDVHTVLHADEGRPARLSFVFTARHEPAEIDAAVDALSSAAGELPYPARVETG